MKGPQIALLADGRLHLNHGPIDLIVQAWGAGVQAAYRAAAQRFETILDELVAELPALRLPDAPLRGAVARDMGAAVAPFRPLFITPMAAVAGAVAQTILAALARPDITRAYVNNGGDIALHLTEGHSLTCAVAGGADRITLHHADPVRGVATSGWRGRSHSLGIADAVTVLAPTAAMADAAATMIANAVNLPDHPAITRCPATDLRPDSDLGPRLVTTAVGPLTAQDTATALQNGQSAALGYQSRGLIHSAALYLNGETRLIGPKLPELAYA